LPSDEIWLIYIDVFEKGILIMRYHLRERAWSLTESFTIKDEQGHEVFEVRGKFFHIGDNLVLIDRHSGQQLLQIKQKLISIRPSYDIYRGGEHWGNVHEQLHLFGERFRVKGENGMEFEIHGSVQNWHFAINDAQGNLLARVGREFSLFRDSYAVEIAQGVDVPFVIALTIVLEMVKEHHDH
jgi:uncharacterized protein YxjI